MTLIAKILIVASTVGADGKTVRKEFKPGAEVTGLSDHDERELLKMKALLDTDREEASDQYEAMRAEHAQREFERERQAVLQKRGSTEPPAGLVASTDGTGQTAALIDGAGGNGAADGGQGDQGSSNAGDGQGAQDSSNAGESAAPAPDASTASAPTPAPAAAPSEQSKGTGKGAPKRN